MFLTVKGVLWTKHDCKFYFAGLKYLQTARFFYRLHADITQ